MKTGNFILLLIGLSWCAIVQAQTDQETPATENNSRKPVFRGLPTAYYTPETRIAVEAFAYASFYTDSVARKSNVRLFAAVTQNKQVTIDLPWQIFTKGERYRIDGKLDIRKFPEYYYGIGNNTVEKDRKMYEYGGFGLRNSALRLVGGNNYFGVFFEGRLLKTDSLPVFLETETPTLGAGGFRFAGIGPSFIHDSRDVVLCATDGKYLELTATVNASRFTEASSALRSFYKFIADYRQFFSVSNTTVLAYQLVGYAAFGAVPYREMPSLGGPLLHRGYYFGRFRDRHLVCAQFEVRQHLFWRVGGVAFGSVGRVYPNFQTPFFKDQRPAAGAGLRFKLSKKDEANIRFDVAVTTDSRGFYLYFAEAF